MASDSNRPRRNFIRFLLSPPLRYEAFVSFLTALGNFVESVPARATYENDLRQSFWRKTFDASWTIFSFELRTLGTVSHVPKRNSEPTTRGIPRNIGAT